MTRKLGGICGHICSPSQIVHGWYDLKVKGIYPLEVTQIEIIMVYDSLYLCLCYTSHLENSLFACTWASLHCYQNINFSIPRLLIRRNQSPSVYGFKCFTM